MPNSRWSLRRGVGRKALLSSIATALVGIVAALLAGAATERHNTQMLNERFADLNRHMVAEIGDRMSMFEHGLRGARGALIATDGNIGRERFVRYSRSRDYQREFPGVRGFGYAQRVPPEQRAAFLQKARDDGAENLHIRQFAPHDGESYVLLYFEPYPTQGGPAGLDLASEPARRTAAIAAARSGMPVMTSPILLQSAPFHGRQGFLILLADYREGMPLDTPEARARAARGWALASLEASHLLTHLALHRRDVELSLADTTSPDAPFFQVHQAQAAEGAKAITSDLPVYGRHWRLTARPTKTFIRSLNQIQPWWVVSGVTALFILLAALQYQYLSNRFRRTQVLRHQTELASLVSHSSEAIIAEDAKGRITHWNPAAERIFGHTRAQALDQDRLALLVPEPYLPPQIAELMPGEDPSPTLVEQMRHRDGRVVYVLSSIAPIVGGHGQTVGHSHFVRDVTERVVAQQRVLEANATLEQQVQERTSELVRYSALQHAILAHAGYAIVATDRQGLITLFNPAAEKLLGYSAHDMIGRGHPEQFLDATELERRAEDASREAGHPVAPRLEAIAAESSLGRSDTREWTYVASNGRRLPVLLTLSTLLDAQDQVIGYLAMAVDLSEQKLREQQLRLAIDSAENANRSKSDFLANMSHEIRTPMNAILGMLYLLSRSSLAPAAKDMVQKIDVSARSLLEIINDILDFSKIEAGRIDLEIAPFDLNQLLEDLGVLMGNSLENKPVEMVIESAPEDCHWFLGDALRLNQVLINLVGNAVKFTENGEVVLSVRTFPAGDASKVKLLFSVRDTGIGISREKQELIFSPFLQADTSTSRQFGGSGLGLTISARLVELMDGELKVDSVLGQGSEFYFAISLERAAPPAHALPLPHAPAATERAPRVLIADDHELALSTLSGIASSLGWEVRAVASGAEALAEIKASAQDPFDIYLLDWCMPEIDGLDVAQHVRETAAPGHRPVIVMVTAYERRLLEQQPDHPGIDAVMTKPVSATALHRTVTALDHQASEDAATAQTRSAERLSGARLLLVDDSHINCEVAQRILQGEGAAVEVAHDGQQALDMLQRQPGHFHLVLMDVQMPRMDGYEATARLRRDTALSDLPVIALTAGAYRQQQDLALQAGMNGFVSKPFQVDELVDMIWQFLPRTVRATRLGNLPAPPQAPLPQRGWTSSAPELLDGERAQQFWEEPGPYQRYLARLFHDDPDPAATLGGLIETGDIAAAIALAHKLRGSCGSLALPRLGQAAAQLEHELEQGRSGRDALTELHRAAVDTAAAIEVFLRRNRLEQAPDLAQQDTTEPDTASDGEGDPLARLILALQTDDADQIEQTLASVTPYIPEELRDQLQRLVENFDFRVAEDQVRRHQADITS